MVVESYHSVYNIQVPREERVKLHKRFLLFVFASRNENSNAEPREREIKEEEEGLSALFAIAIDLCI